MAKAKKGKVTPQDEVVAPPPPAKVPDVKRTDVPKDGPKDREKRQSENVVEQGDGKSVSSKGTADRSGGFASFFGGGRLRTTPSDGRSSGREPLEVRFADPIDEDSGSDEGDYDSVDDRESAQEEDLQPDNDSQSPPSSSATLSYGTPPTTTATHPPEPLPQSHPEPLSATAAAATLSKAKTSTASSAAKMTTQPDSPTAHWGTAPLPPEPPRVTRERVPASKIPAWQFTLPPIPDVNHQRQWNEFVEGQGPWNRPRKTAMSPGPMGWETWSKHHHAAPPHHHHQPTPPPAPIPPPPVQKPVVNHHRWPDPPITHGGWANEPSNHGWGPAQNAWAGWGPNEPAHVPHAVPEPNSWATPQPPAGFQAWEPPKRTHGHKPAASWDPGLSQNWGVDELESESESDESEDEEGWPSGGNRNALPPHQNIQLLNSIIHEPQHHGVAHAPHHSTSSRNHKPYLPEDWGRPPQGKISNTLKKSRHASGPVPMHTPPQHPSWGTSVASGSDESRRVKFSPQSTGQWEGSPETTSTNSSRTMGHAMKTNSVHLPFNPSSIIESQGAALASVSHALFGNSKRKARDRIYWFFSPDKDPRVVEFMKWINASSAHIAELGVQKFIQTGERGGLIANVEFCVNTRPTLDWLTYPDLQKTCDFVLQESAAWYNPAKHVLLFVFLPSKSTNSVAIWRKMIDIPEQTRRAMLPQIKATMAGLKNSGEYSIHLDETGTPSQKATSASASAQAAGMTPPTAPLPPAPPPGKDKPVKVVKAKKKWWRLFGRPQTAHA